MYNTGYVDAALSDRFQSLLIMHSMILTLSVNLKTQGVKIRQE